MAYFVFDIDTDARRESLLRTLVTAKSLGIQLCMVFELTLLYISTVKEFRERYDASKNVTINIQRLYWVLQETEVVMSTLSVLERFRNNFVHNGVDLAQPLFVKLVSDEHLYNLLTICRILDVRLDFTLDL